MKYINSGQERIVFFRAPSKGIYARVYERVQLWKYERALEIYNGYRSQSYYDSGSWRATWAGEGGGVLFNQCPHQLDLLQRYAVFTEVCCR